MCDATTKWVFHMSESENQSPSTDSRLYSLPNRASVVHILALFTVLYILLSEV